MKNIIFQLFALSIFLSFYQAPILGQEYLSLYPDPVLADSVPRIFAPGIISKELAHDEGIAFSPNGKQIFFTRSIADEEGERQSFLLYLEKKGDKWSKPAKPSFASDVNESDPSFSRDGQVLYFFSERRKPGISPYIGEIWQVVRSNGNWGKPRYNENILNASWINSLSSTSDGTLFFSSYRDNKIGIYYSELKNGKYQNPVFLPEEVNSIPGATNPFISADGETLLFEGQALGYGNTELYISFKTSEGHWTPGRKLGKTVNKTLTETTPALSPDGKYLFFTREGDIYWVRIEYVF
ncbi:MAG: hypothetical protein ACOCWA_07395 [Bacteroidota bacterium]